MGNSVAFLCGKPAATESCFIRCLEGSGAGLPLKTDCRCWAPGYAECSSWGKNFLLRSITYSLPSWREIIDQRQKCILKINQTKQNKKTNKQTKTKGERERECVCVCVCEREREREGGRERENSNNNKTITITTTRKRS